MKKLFYLLILLALPVMVNARTITCTTKPNYVVGKDVYKSVSASCDEGTVNPFAICEDGSKFDDGAGGTTCYAKAPYPAVEGKTYTFEFQLILKNATTSDDKLVVDGEDWSFMVQFCGEDEDGCLLAGKSAKPKAATNTTTKQGETTTTTKKTTTTTKKVENINVYWVQFDVNGGKEEIKQQAVEEGKTATKPADPTRDGYTFAEWQLDGKKFDFSTKITKSIKLKAVWNEDATGKKNISFVNLYDFSAPYSGTALDTQITIETVDTWTIKMFNVGIDWYRGKSKDSLTEKVASPYKHKAEDGYYYQAVITLTPGDGYTLKNTKLTINGKYVSTTQDENKVIAKWNVYGPVKKGENLEPKLILQDRYDIIYKNNSYKDVPIYFSVDSNFREDITADGDSFIQVSNTEDFEAGKTVILGGGLRNVITSSPGGYGEDGLYELGSISLKKEYPGTYSTEVFFYDTQGRKYSATVTVVRKAVNAKPVKLKSDKNALITAEVMAEMEKHWMFNFTELSNLDNGQKTYDNGYLSELGGEIEVYKISISNDEDGELKNASVTIKIPLTDEIKKYKNHSFIYVSQDFQDQVKLGDTVKAHIDGDFLVVTLPHLSTWALVGNNDEEASEPETKTTNITTYFIIGGVVVVAAACVIVVSKKKNKSTK